MMAAAWGIRLSVVGGNSRHKERIATGRMELFKDPLCNSSLKCTYGMIYLHLKSIIIHTKTLYD